MKVHLLDRFHLLFILSFPLYKLNEFFNISSHKTDDSYEGRSPDSFNYASYTPRTPEKQPLRFNATLISPSGDVKCFIEVVIAYKKPPPSLQKVGHDDGDDFIFAVCRVVKAVNILENARPLVALTHAY